MSNNNNIPTQVSERALEMIMRDVLDGLHEASLETSLQQNGSYFRIIQGPRDQSREASGKVQIEAEIIHFPQTDRTAG